MHARKENRLRTWFLSEDSKEIRIASLKTLASVFTICMRLGVVMHYSAKAK